MTSYDTPDMQGFKIAMDEVNAAGGINGRKIALISEDSVLHGSSTMSGIVGGLYAHTIGSISANNLWFATTL
jgi:ABC-type branched-subunit amino acid transport system permease subunit